MSVPTVHYNTVCGVLSSFRLHWRKPHRKFYVSSKHIANCLKWAHCYKHWTRFYWRHVIWSDESYVYVGDNKGSVYITQYADEEYNGGCMIPTFKQLPVHVMVWVCIADGLQGPLVILDYLGGKGGGMTADHYADQILDGPLLDFYMKISHQRSFIFVQQDNATCHTAKKQK